MDSATQRLAALMAPLTNYERDRPNRPRFGLETMQRLLAALEAELPRAKLIQVGGSKGKGSTALYIEKLAEAGDLRTGLYLSPHLQSILERVRVGGKNVTEAELRASIEHVLAKAQQENSSISFFEAMCAASLLCFARAGVDCGVLEVGLGGRLDATTAVELHTSILTGIEREHGEILGESIREISIEKSHVIRKGGICFCAAEGEALEVFVQRARDVSARLLCLGRDFGIDALAYADGRWTGELWSKEHSRQKFSLPDAPEIELQALALAWISLRHLFPDRQLLPEQMDRPHLPGRFEVFFDSSGRPLVLDGAHTEASLRILGAELERRFPAASRRFLFATAPKKRWREGLGSILRPADEVLVTGLLDTRSEDPATICEHLCALGFRARQVEDGVAGLRELQAGEGLAVVTGSFYLVGEVRDVLMR